MIYYALILIGIVGVDYIVKLWASNVLAAKGSITIIEGVFNLTYAENTGAAFSMLEGKRWFFIILTIVMLGVIAYAFFTEYFKGKWGRTTMVFIFAGALGNLIDRILYGYVVDMFDFFLINFAIFNVADIFITIGGIMAVIYVFFIDKEFFVDNRKAKTK
jgi:signal peptidase II